MKTINAILFSLSLLLAMNSCTPKQDKFLLLGGSGWDKLVIIDKENKSIVWEYPVEEGWECNSVAATPEGNILFSYGKGAKLITRDKQEVWNINAPEGCEMQTARVLPNGNYLLAWCGYPATILEVGKEGKIITRTDFDTRIQNPHSQFRQVNKNKKGNYLVPLFETSEVREISRDGGLVKKVKVEGTPFCIEPLKNGNYLVACGDAHSYMEVNMETGEVVRRVGAEDIEGATLFFVAHVRPTATNGLYICNWQGHSRDAASANSPQLMELDASGKILWSINDNTSFGMISSVSPID